MMTSAMTPSGNEKEIRAIVFKEDGCYVAQCLEYDIAVQASDIPALIARLELTVDAEFAACEDRGEAPRECIAPAPTYYHDLWKKQVASITPVKVATPTADTRFALSYGMAA